MAPLEPKVSQFGSAMAWLLAKDVSAERLGSLFGTTAGNVRVIAFRARQLTAIKGTRESVLADPPTVAQSRSLGLRVGEDEVVPSPPRERSLKTLREQIERTIARRVADRDFLAGLEELRKLLPQLGYPGDSRRIGLGAMIHQQMAWFLVHTGRADAAVREARASRGMWRRAHHEFQTSEYGKGFINASLIGSQALLLSNRPEDALTLLDVAADAAKAVDQPLGSDHFRQRGIALFQLRNDAEARRQFQMSGDQMEKLNETSLPAQLLLTRARYLALINLDWEQGREVLEVARKSFGEESLEASMSLHWAAAAQLSTDSPSALANAYQLLTTHSKPAGQFGHQSTIRKLLLMTHELGLYTTLRRAWVRRALYENAFRTR